MKRPATKPHADDVALFVDHLKRAARGRAEALTARHLTLSLGFRDRYLRMLAHAANQAGYLICADNAGYFVPISRAEVAETVARLRSQSYEMAGRADLLERLAADTFTAPRRRRTAADGPGLFDDCPENGALVATEVDYGTRPGGAK